MRVKKTTVIRNGIIVAGVLMLLSAVVVLLRPTPQPESASAVYENENGVQVIEIFAKGGYSPKEVTAKAGKETVLRFTTNSTYDCSASLYIAKLNVDKILPATGKTDISVGIADAGSEITGACSGGSYGFKVKFL